MFGPWKQAVRRSFDSFFNPYALWCITCGHWTCSFMYHFNSLSGHTALPFPSWHWNEYVFSFHHRWLLMFGIIPRANKPKSCVYYHIGRLCPPERYVHVPHPEYIISINVLKIPSKKKLWCENELFYSRNYQYATNKWYFSTNYDI